MNLDVPKSLLLLAIAATATAADAGRPGGCGSSHRAPRHRAPVYRAPIHRAGYAPQFVSPAYRPPPFTQPSAHGVRPQPVTPIAAEPRVNQPPTPTPPATSPGQPATLPQNQLIARRPAAQQLAREPQSVRPRSVAGASNAAQASELTLTTRTSDTSTSVESNALELLGSVAEDSGSDDRQGSPMMDAVDSSASPTHVGVWRVTLPGDQAVQLSLAADGTFQWTAARKGKTTTFEGQYRLESDRLTLVRSTDLQQMAGSWIGEGGSFVFKLDGANNAGLKFSRG